ncbi:MULTISPECIES: LysR family substrate-binding domain-containing protein [unclassified Arthrobacter]|uniref:LysR family substrate-binding domain-containing protein n=1 Tax=unclassified Arthrobacter TaxID=235627 RepID=UPI0002F45939|nr:MULTISPECIES: LysR family substrate-binding domain-containing protein [unclassified Arthrobacter]PVE19775.1 LysR family transcriptional regulator [Arthrobacter sp. Bz4]
MSEPQPSVLTVGFVPGVTPGKWVSRWRDRFPAKPLETREYEAASQEEALRAGTVDLGFVRLPVDREGLSVIPLYEEQPVVVAGKDHELSLFDEVPLAELAAENHLDVIANGGEKATIELAATGAGVVIVPMSIARLYARKDAVHRPVLDVPATTIAVAWLSENTAEDIEEFIGIVRGRTERSSRQPSAKEPEKKEKKAQKAASKKQPSARSSKPTQKAGGPKKPAAGGKKQNPRGRKPGAGGRGRR